MTRRTPNSGSGRSTGRSSGAGRGAGRPTGSGRPTGTGRSGNARTSSGGRSPASGRATGSGQRASTPASRGAGRTGRVRGEGEPPTRRPQKTLGGEQVEGRQAVRELLVAGTRKVREVWVATSDAPGGGRSDVVGDIVDLARSMRVQVTEVSRVRLDNAARSEAPQGVIAFAAPLEEVELAELLTRRAGRPPFLVAVDGVTDPGNLGALLRCCDGAGVTGVVLPRHRAVHITPTAAKAAAGAIEHVRMSMVGGLPAALSRVRDAGVWVVGLDDAADKSLFDLGDLANDAICLVLGAEGPGLSRLVRERCDLVVSIPMRGRLSSLNVSAAGALATYEVARHRR